MSSGHGTALGGVRVLEIGGTGAVPYCGRLLGMLGAEVTKVERPGGDRVARRLPPLLEGMPAMEKSAMFFYLNAGKRLVTVDLTSPSGGELFGRLLSVNDVVVHNRPIVSGYEMGPTLSREHAELVQCAITPFGWDGPNAKFSSSDIVTNAVGGDCYLTPAGLAHHLAPEREPLKLAGFSASYGVGIIGALSIVASLWNRATTSIGDFIDISEQEVHVSMSREQIMWAANENVLETRDTRAMPVGGCFECVDGFVQIYVFSNEHWDALRSTMGDPEWAKSDNYASALQRAEHSEEINAGIAHWMLGEEREAVYSRAKKNGATLAPFLSPEEILFDSHEVERAFFMTAELPNGALGRAPSRPFHMSATPAVFGGGPTSVGAHNREVYRSIGLSDSEIESLASAGVI